MVGSMQIIIQYVDQIRLCIKYIGESKNIKFSPTLCKYFTPEMDLHVIL